MEINKVIMIKEIAILLTLSVITAFTVNFFSPRGIALVGQWDTSQGVINARAKNDAVDHGRELSISQAGEIYLKGTSVFVDARPHEMYEEGHIKDAVSLPAYEFDMLIDKFLETYSPTVPIITYCSGRECEDSHILAKNLSDMGYSDVKVFIDGYPAWKQGGNPIE